MVASKRVHGSTWKTLSLRYPMTTYASVAMIAGFVLAALIGQRGVRDILADVGIALVASTLTVLVYNAITTRAREQRERQERGLAETATALGLTGAATQDLPVERIAKLLDERSVHTVKISIMFDPNLWAPTETRRGEPVLLDELCKRLAPKDSPVNGHLGKVLVLVPDPENEAVKEAVKSIWENPEIGVVLERMRGMTIELHRVAEHCVGFDVSSVPRLPNQTVYRFETRDKRSGFGYARFYARNMTIVDKLPIVEFAFSEEKNSLWVLAGREFGD